MVWPAVLNLTVCVIKPVNVSPGLSATDTSDPAVFWKVSWWTPHPGKCFSHIERTAKCMFDYKLLDLCHSSLICFPLFSCLCVCVCVCVISEQCQVSTQGAPCANRPSHQGLPQFALHHRLQPHHSASGKNTAGKPRTALPSAIVWSYTWSEEASALQQIL